MLRSVIIWGALLVLQALRKDDTALRGQELNLTLVAGGKSFLTPCLEIHFAESSEVDRSRVAAEEGSLQCSVVLRAIGDPETFPVLVHPGHVGSAIGRALALGRTHGGRPQRARGAPRRRSGTCEGRIGKSRFLGFLKKSQARVTLSNFSSNLFVRAKTALVGLVSVGQDSLLSSTQGRNPGFLERFGKPRTQFRYTDGAKKRDAWLGAGFPFHFHFALTTH